MDYSSLESFKNIFNMAKQCCFSLTSFQQIANYLTWNIDIFKLLSLKV